MRWIDCTVVHGTRIAPLWLFLVLAGCGRPLTDGATRLAKEIGEAATNLRESKATRIEIQHKPLPQPEGVTGPYEIVMQASINHPAKGGSLLVGDINSAAYKKRGYNWSTTSHLHHVRVPAELRIEKKAGESVIVVLELDSDGKINVKELR